MIRRLCTVTAIAVLTGTLSTAAAMAQTNPGAFRCPVDDEVFLWFEPFQDQLDALTDSRRAELIVIETVNDWDARYIVEQCERAARGESADFGCLHDRRDWGAIQGMLPANLNSMNMDEENAHLSVLRNNEYNRNDAFWHCHDLGVIDRSLQP